ncbi:MAG: glycosyltransferase [Bacteroidales bacterium]|nr:glycosyltransferase [Bacteroidales bacterium]
MKIIIIGSAYPLRGGLTAFNERLAREFNSHGHDVQLYTFSLQYPGFLFPGKTQYSSDPPPEDLKIKVKINSVNPFNWFRVGKELKKFKPDLVVIKFWIPFMAPCLGTIARIIRKNKVTKVISVIDNIVPHEKRIGDRILANYWVKSVDGFITMSRQVLGELDTFDKLKPKLYHPHPLYDNFGDIIDKTEARQMLGFNASDKIILFFGFIRDYKGLDLLLKAMANPVIKESDISLLVAGEFYTDNKSYLSVIKENELEDKVILHTEFIPDGDVAKYFCASDLVVQPYKHATQSGVTQIAYYFNKPMITTNVGGLAEIVPDEKVGFVVKPEEKEISEAIYRFFTENRESEFIRNVIIEKQKYSWDNFVGSLVKVYYICSK